MVEFYTTARLTGRRQPTPAPRADRQL